MPKKNILIIDDDTLLCWALSRRISRMGVNAVCASTGNDSLINIGLKDFDIIIIDINLPDVNGLELMDIIKVRSPLSKFIIITAETKEEYRQVAIDKGAVDFIEKPFGFAEIKKLINSILSDWKEKRKFQRDNCNISCSISVLEKNNPVEDENRNKNYLNGTAFDISKKGIGLRLNKNGTNFVKGNFVRLLPGVRDHSSFDFLPSNTIAEIVWVKDQGSEIFIGLKYINSPEFDKLF